MAFLLNRRTTDDELIKFVIICFTYVNEKVKSVIIKFNWVRTLNLFIFLVSIKLYNTIL